VHIFKKDTSLIWLYKYNSIYFLRQRLKRKSFYYIFHVVKDWNESVSVAQIFFITYLSITFAEVFLKRFMLPSNNILLFAIKTFLFLLICFCVGRGVEMVIICNSFAGLSIVDALPSFYQALYLDAATACYGVLFLSMLYTCYQLLQWKPIFTFIQFTILAIIIIYSFIISGESLLYTEWKTKLNIQALLHFTNPKEVFSTASWKQIAIFGMVSFVLILLLWKLWKLFSIQSEPFLKKWQTCLFLLPIVAICGIGLRGGLQPIPIQISDACYSNNAVYNDIAINPLFSLAANYKSYIDFEKSNPYTTMPMKDAQNILKQTFTDSTAIIPSWLLGNKTNIVMIFLESWSADICAFTGGDGYAKNMDSLAQNGIAFTNCYAAGYASDQGIPAVLSGHPASAKTSIINESSKSIHLPSITLDAKNAGYETGFYFGGQLNYGNIKNYLIQKKVDNIKEQSDIDASKFTVQRLGICDADMANYFVQQINYATPPFFYNWFTLSSHAPYDMPSKIISKTSEENPYTNSVIYSDSALGYFMREAKKQKWYANTLFVIVADHSHNSHLHNDMHTAARHKIPLVLFGDVIAPEWKGKKVNQVVSHTDIATTIMQAAKISFIKKDYQYSKNLFIQNHIAPYCFYDGGGIITDSFVLGYGIGNMEKAIYAKGKIDGKDSIITKSILQCVFEEFRIGKAINN
jgi:phosphoglycerol transferase MdoB-like AlkP superfamily enzyme